MDRILIVEDDEDLSQSLEAVLANGGFDVSTAGSREEAEQALGGSQGFSAVVVDVNLPDGHGISLIQEWRSRDPNVRIVAMTGGGDLGPNVGLPLATAHGAEAVLLKPFEPRELLAAVRGDSEAA